MRIAMVSEHASPLAVLGGVDAGGQNVHVAALAEALAARGHEVAIYTRRDSPDLPRRVPLCAGVVVEHLDAGPPRQIGKDQLLPFVPAMGEELARRLPAFGPALVHAHFWMSGLAALRGTRDTDVPVVQTFHALGSVKRRHQGVEDTSPRERIADEQLLARGVDRIIGSCTDEVRELVRMGAQRSRIDVVPCGVDLSVFTADGPRAQRGQRPRLLVVGRLVPRKGVDDVIRALQWLPDAELVVAGGPDPDALANDPESRRLAALADELHLADRVRLLGRVEHLELPALIRSADVVVCLPWYEPFGIVPLEAMACGVPVVGSAVGGLLDTVIDGVTGALLPPRRPRQAARVIGALLADPTRRDRYAAAGCARAQSYGWAHVARETERSYVRAVVARNRSALTSKEYAG
jgi:glycosyltransferase involved in cell wall biosynthesis